MKTVFKSIFYLTVFLIFLFVLGGVARVSAGNEACGGSTPKCWNSRDISQWACDWCNEWTNECTDGKTCNGNLDCAPYGTSPCMSLCTGTIYGGEKDSCHLTGDLYVACNNTGPGECNWTGTMQDCQSEYGSCSINTGTETMGCCGPGGSTPTPGPTSSPPPPNTCSECGTYPNCFTKYCDNSVCTCGCASTSCSGGVCQPCPESCTLNLTPAAANIAVAGTQTLTATVTPTNGTITNVSFVSGTPSRVTVNPASDTTSPYTTVATGVSGGSAVVTATATMDNGITTCTDTSVITVLAPSCTLSLTPVTANIADGGTQTFTATVTPTGGTISSVGFVSGTPAVATVSPASDTTAPYTTVATGISGGNSVITATATMNDGITTCTDTSTLTIWSCTVSLAPVNPTVLIGGTQVLTATVTPIGDTISSVGFVSGTPAVATVSPASDTTVPYGTGVTGVSSGTSTVTATATMTLGGTCFDTTVITVPACTVTLTPNPKTLTVGDTWPFTAAVANITPDSVSFTSSNTGAVTVNPASDTISPYITTGTAVAAGSSILTASAISGGVTKCSGIANVNVNNSTAWWQVKDGDVSTNGNLGSAVPAGLYFDVKGDNTYPAFAYPGIPAYGGVLTGTLTGANVSETGWLANSGYDTTKKYDSNYFQDAIPSDVLATLPNITATSVPGSTFESGGTFAYGYYWYEYDGTKTGDLTINSAISLSGKRDVIFIVKGADAILKGNINILNKGQGFFLLVTTGNIIVDPGVGGGGIANLEGIFVSDGQFQAGVGVTQLWVRGTVAAYGGVLLNGQRDLGAANSTTPAEKFEFAPDLVLLFPRTLGVRPMNWQEVAP